jgi:DNA helicase HerA-like ATPase
MIFSKGVGVFFITQYPNDVPDQIIGQLGNRIQHALRAFTPKDKKALKAAAANAHLVDRADKAWERPLPNRLPAPLVQTWEGRLYEAF